MFIREDVEKTMREMVQYATPGKLLLAIIAGGQRCGTLRTGVTGKPHQKRIVLESLHVREGNIGFSSVI